MTYNPASDFVGLWHGTASGVEKAQMPGLDFVVEALNRAGILTVVTGPTAPAANQVTTAWFKPATPSYGSEGALYLWDKGSNTYVPATATLFRNYINSDPIQGSSIVGPLPSSILSGPIPPTVPTTGVTNGSNAAAGQVGELLYFTFTQPYTGADIIFGDTTIGTVTPGDWSISAGISCTSAINQFDVTTTGTLTGFTTNLNMSIQKTTSINGTLSQNALPCRASITVATAIPMHYIISFLATGSFTIIVSCRRVR